MIKLVDFQTRKAFPAEMRTPERIALAYAYDRQKKKFIDRMKRVYIWADLDQVDDGKLDFLAVENRVLFYNTALAPDVKRSLIRNSIYWYMKLGTRQAMEEMIDTVFGNENTSVEEWYTYAGEPFHFRIAVGTEVTQTSIKDFLRYLKQVKNARSRFDYMVFQNGITLTIYQLSEYQNFLYTFCGDHICGTFPYTEVGFQPAEVTITLEGAADSGNTAYTEAGTAPDISVGAALTENRVDIQTASEENHLQYSTDSDRESGTEPDISVGFRPADMQLEIEPDSRETDIVYPMDSSAESGTYPGISTGFQGTEAGIIVDAETDSGRVSYDETGTAPDISVGAAFSGGQIEAQGASGENIFQYQTDSDAESGTIPDISTGFQGAAAEVDLGAAADSGSAAYDQSGTIPDISTGFQGGGAEMGLTAAAESHTAAYDQSGTAPDISVGAQITEVQATLESDSAGNEVIYPADSNTESGSIPEPSIGFAGAESGVSVAPDSVGVDLYYNTDAGKYAADE